MWKLVEDKRKRELIGWFASGAVAIIAGAWAVYTHVYPAEAGKVNVVNDCSVGAAGDIKTGGDINIKDCAPKKPN